MVSGAVVILLGKLFSVSLEDKAGHTVLIRFHKTGDYVPLACLCLHDTSSLSKRDAGERNGSLGGC